MCAIARVLGLLAVVAGVILIGYQFGPFVGMPIGFLFVFLLLLFIPERWL